MKRKLLTMLAFALACTGAWAYETGDNGAAYNDYGVRCWVDRDNNIQYIDVKTAGGFGNFVNNGDFNTFFNSASGTTWKTVVFSGTMNNSDLQSMTNACWNGVAFVDFSKATGLSADNIINDLPTSSDQVARMIIFPKTVNVTPAVAYSLQDRRGNGNGNRWYGYFRNGNTGCMYVNENLACNSCMSTFVEGLKNMYEDPTLGGMVFAYTLNNTNSTDYPTYGGEISQDWNDLYSDNSQTYPTFFAAMKAIPVSSLDLSGINAARLGYDCTVFNSNTHYFIVPINSADHSVNFSYEAPGTENRIVMNDNIYVIATAKGTKYGDGTTNAPYGPYYEDINTTVLGETALVTYVRKAGELPNAGKYIAEELKGLTHNVILGKLNKDDLGAMSFMQNKCVDFSYAEFVGGASVSDLTCTNANYVALPYNTTKEAVDAAYNKLSSGSLKCVGTFVIDATDEVAAKTFISYSKEQGHVKHVADMLKYGANCDYMVGVPYIENVIMSGQLNAFDICNSTSAAAEMGTVVSATNENNVTYHMALASDGHLYASSKVPQGLTTLSSGALQNASLNSINFEHAIFDQPSNDDLIPDDDCPGYFSADEKLNLITDMNFTALGIIPNEVILPTDASQKVIPPFFIGQNSGKCIKEICIPANFQYIMDGAFNKCENNLYHIYTTVPNPKPQGLIDEEVDHGVEYDADGKPYKSTYTIGSTVKYIGTAAFDTQDKNPLSDVYVLAQVAPTCEPNAFNSAKLIGNNGFKPGHPICRDNYINNGMWIAILHYPNSIGDAAKKYTDIDRDYWYTDETGAVDGEGNLLKWPAHTEFFRSYNQARWGYTWNEWPTDRTGLPGWGNYGEIIASGPNDFDYTGDPKIQTVAIQDGANIAGDFTTTLNGQTLQNKTQDCGACGFANTIGWHQFLLSSPGYFYEVESTKYVETPWYTFCIPFDMTRQELNKYLGVPANATSNPGAEPDVRTLRAVERNTTSRHTDIVISKNLIAEGKDIETYGATDNKYQLAQYVDINTTKDNIPVYLKGGYPYFVKGWVPEGTDLSKYNNNLGQYVLAIANFDTEDLGNVIIINPSATAVSDDNIVNTKHYEAGDRNFIAMPYFNHTVDAKSTVDECFYGERTNLPTGITEDVPYLYNFMGNYEPEDFATTEAKEMPQYSYYMASGKIYRYKTKKSGYLWKPYICMIGLNGEGSVYQTPISGVMTYHSAYDKVADDNKWGINEFAQEGDESSAGTFSIVFDEDDIPGGDVDKIINLNGQEMDVKVSAIYNLNGQYVGNSLNSLAKGVYVVNGKKIVVK